MALINWVVGIGVVAFFCWGMYEVFVKRILSDLWNKS
jgi:hypothetical protein